MQCAFFFLIPSGSRILYSTILYILHSSACRCCNNPQYMWVVVECCTYGMHTVGEYIPRYVCVAYVSHVYLASWNALPIYHLPLVCANFVPDLFVIYQLINRMGLRLIPYFALQHDENEVSESAFGSPFGKSIDQRRPTQKPHNLPWLMKEGDVCSFSTIVAFADCLHNGQCSVCGFNGHRCFIVRLCCVH